MMLAAACSTESSPETETVADAGTSLDTGTSPDAGETSPAGCAYPLVRLVTGSDPACGGGLAHTWPIGMAASDCHGWASLDPTGAEHLNSANNIRCNADGSFSFDQFADTLTCQGTATTKVYALDTCERDIPPTLYTMAVDLTCCLDPTSADCKVGVPSAGQAGTTTIYKNNVACTP
jgi:hypothetical protein